MKRGDRCYFFVFSLVYLVWGSLVYNIYHHVFKVSVEELA